MSTLMKFQSGALILQFEAAGDYPAVRRNEVIQVTDRNAAGALQVETLGIKIKSRVINFTMMPKADYIALVEWFLDVANASANTFDFTDEYGDVGTVRFTSPILNFPETSFELYEGSITLEYES
jgi:hypothetical protein